MQKKKLISIAIALTLQSYYIPAIAAENNDDEKECPSNISSLPKEKRAKLSPTCLATPENDNHWAGLLAALLHWSQVWLLALKITVAEILIILITPLRPIMAATLPHPTMAATSPRLTMAAMTM